METFARKRAVAELTKSLAAHEPIVRSCVARRLSRLVPLEELAAELGLELKDVEFILKKMRPWVQRFTTYFNKEYYWRDDVPRFEIPDLPQPAR